MLRAAHPTEVRVFADHGASAGMAEALRHVQGQADKRPQNGIPE